MTQHGIDCRKVTHHESGGYLHAEDDDAPYTVDGVEYCGRCHWALDDHGPHTKAWNRKPYDRGMGTKTPREAPGCRGRSAAGDLPLGGET